MTFRIIPSSIVSVSAASLLMLASCHSSEEKNKPVANTDPAIAVTTSVASAVNNNSSSYSGQVEAAQTANISTRVMGYITRLNVKTGDHVNAGQVIATISNSDILAKRSQAEAGIAEAEAALANARKDLDRFTALYKQQSATAKELDNVTLQYNAMKAKTEAAHQMKNEVNAMLSYTTLTAPFSGTVTQKLADAGSMANPGMPIVTIEQSGTYQVSASVPETEINQLHLGQQVTVQIRSINRMFRAGITQINPSSQFTGGQYIITINVPAAERKGLYTGMYANIMAEGLPKEKKQNEPEGIWVPMASIVHQDQLTGIYTISSNHTALLRWVRLGKTADGKAEVLSGLGKDEPFIVQADGKLYNGSPVKIK